MVVEYLRKQFKMIGDNKESQCTRSIGGGIKAEKSRDKSSREALRFRRTGTKPNPLLIQIPKDFYNNKINSNKRKFDKNDMSETPLIYAEETMANNDQVDNMVMLEVGPDRDTWRYFVERQRLADKSEWFRAMLVGPLAPPPSTPPPTVRLEHVEKRAFDHLLRHLNDEPVNFQSVSTARSTLDVAHQYLCLQLAKLAVKYLEANLNSSNVLEVVQGLSLYAGNMVSCTNKPDTPSAPPAPGDEAGEIALACASLLSACLTLIDSDPASVLRQERFEELSNEEVAEIAARDSLRLKEEGVLFTALDRWAASECRRHGVEPTPCNKRHVLSDDVWFSVRYPLMTDKQFIEGPMASGILSSKESAFIVSKILGHHRNNERLAGQQPDSNGGALSRLSTKPRGSSASTTSSASSGISGSPSAYKQKQKSHKCGKKERDENRKNRKRECASHGQRACTSFGNCLVRVLACVFD